MGAVSCPPALSALFVFSVLLPFLAVLHSAEPSKRCPDYFCNNAVGNIRFPFKSRTQPPECGLYTVDCSNRSHPRLQLKEGGYWHELIGPLGSTIFINDTKLQEEHFRASCSDEVFDALSLPIPSPNLYALFNLTLFQCNNTNTLDNNTSYSHLIHFGCRNPNYVYYTTTSNNSLPSPAPPCPIIQVPIRPDRYYNLSALTTSFSLLLATPECDQCQERRGECLVDKGNFICPGEEKEPGNWVPKVSIVGAAGVVALVVIVCCCFYWKKQYQNRQIVEAILRSYGPLQVTRYSYSEVKKMTNSFKEKLGQGGYGSVYKGKLNNRWLIAVKVLNKVEGNGEEFMNEVAAISRTSHVNIVSLLGFCFEGSKRALIYEFMPNGSLEKFISDASAPEKNRDHHLGWETWDRIALGIACGLEYLHRGCNTRILHFDIKPHNILLDENFTPKISDFGLAKICDRKESFVSMLGARGTAGYIAPEVFSRSFGVVSNKSDVYSYGMMLLEMVGGRRNTDNETEETTDTSESYFPHWIYKRVELDEELGLQSIRNEEDKIRARKMIIVSLWCIQTRPSNRPAMREVIDMLEGSVESLQVPPKPYLYSPP